MSQIHFLYISARKQFIRPASAVSSSTPSIRAAAGSSFSVANRCDRCRYYGAAHTARRPARGTRHRPACSFGGQSDRLWQNPPITPGSTDSMGPVQFFPGAAAKQPVNAHGLFGAHPVPGQVGHHFADTTHLLKCLAEFLRFSRKYPVW